MIVSKQMQLNDWKFHYGEIKIADDGKFEVSVAKAVGQGDAE